MVAITDKRRDASCEEPQPQVNTTVDPDTSAIVYPSSDGEPLAETQEHILAILTALGLLRLYLKEQPAVVFANQFLYYIQGNPKARVAPDVMVVFDIEKRLYGNYKIWEGQQNPKFIIEVTSAGTKDVDWNFKKTLYEQLEVTEYWLFDPYGEWVANQLQGFRLNEDGIYKPISDNCSQVLGLRLEAQEYQIAFYRLDNGEKLLTLEELDEAAQAAYQAIEQAQQAVEQAEQVAEQAEQVAEQERIKAEQAEQRADRLAALLVSMGIDPDSEVSGDR